MDPDDPDDVITGDYVCVEDGEDGENGENGENGGDGEPKFDFVADRQMLLWRIFSLMEYNPVVPWWQAFVVHEARPDGYFCLKVGTVSVFTDHVDLDGLKVYFEDRSTIPGTLETPEKTAIIMGSNLNRPHGEVFDDIYVAAMIMNLLVAPADS